MRSVRYSIHSLVVVLDGRFRPLMLHSLRLNDRKCTSATIFYIEQYLVKVLRFNLCNAIQKSLSF